MLNPHAFNLLLSLFLLPLYGCVDNPTVVSADPNANPSAADSQTPMQRFSSDQQMLESLRRAARVESEQPRFAPRVESAAIAVDAVTQSAAESTSGTNTQVRGVDEADLIKVSGDSVFALSTAASDHGAFEFVQAQESNSSIALQHFSLTAPARLLEQVTLPAAAHWNGLYSVDQQQLLVLQGEGNSALSDAAQNSYWWTGGSVTLRAHSSAQSDRLADALWQLNFDGKLIGSRRIGDTLYLVTEYGAPYVHPRTDEPGNVDALALGDWLPHWQRDGVDQGPMVASNDCYVSAVDERRDSTRITTLVSIPLRAPSDLRSRCMLGTAETLFVSQDALYIATTASYYEDGFNIPESMFFPSNTSTDIHKFSFDDRLSYRGGVRIQGHLGWHPEQRSYRLGEHQGVLSVVTSGSNNWQANNQDHRLYSLAEGREGLEIKAELPNADRPGAIGKPGERVYGTRAVGDKVYVVTFLTTDPLYVIDVSNANDPFIAGELEVPGFSDYLHPVPGDRLLGIGKAASVSDDGDDGRGGWYQGLRLSLFDVADPSNPLLINALEYGDRGSSSDLFQDFHALAWLNHADRSEFALPVDLYRHSSAPQSPWQHGQFVYRGLYRFRITGAGLSEQSVAVVSAESRYGNNARTVLSSNGSAWFYDRGELYYASAESPSQLVPSDR